MAEAVRERPPAALTPPVARLVASPPVGEPLRPPVRTSLERSLGVNLEPVRVHGDARTGKIVDNIPARAFAYGTHVYLGSREQPTDIRIMAHEAAHVVQQRTAPRAQQAGGFGDAGALEREAEQAGEAAGQGETFAVRGRTGGPEVQGGILEWLEDKAWDILNELAPDLAPIIRQGIFAWLEEKITAAIQAVVDVLMAPVRAVGSVIDAIGEQFGELIAWIRDAAARIAKGDCGAITEAATKIEQVIKAFAAPLVDRITGIATKVGDFFKGLWDRFGAPVWDFLKKIGGVVWEKIEQLASWIWKKTEPIRDLAARAWRWVKNKLGIGEGPEGQNGLLQWVQEKASAVWDVVKAKIEPIRKPLMVVAGILLAFSPAGPILLIAGAAVGLYKAVRWIKANLSTPDGVVRQREALRTQIIPAITSAVAGVSGRLTELANGLSETLGRVVGGLGQLVGSLAGSILNFAVGAVEWILNQATRLMTWATGQLTRLVSLVTNALEGLSAFMQPVLGVLGKIVTIVGDVMQLPILFAGRVWNMIPACIRTPFVNFLVNHILKYVPIFGELLADPQVWGKLQEGATRLVRQIFRDHDLKSAIRSAFELILTVFKIPVELVQSIYAKAKSAWDQIYRQPLAFLRNLLRAVRLGFAQFFDPITFLGHLGRGLVEWLTGQLGQVNIRWPGDLSLKSVLGLVTDLLGLTIDKIFERLGKKIGAERAAKLRRALDLLTGALGWVGDLIREGPAGLWKSLVDRLGNLWSTVKDAISNWIVTRIVTSVAKRLLSMLDPTGIMAVVNSLIAVYDTIKVAVEYARKILEFVSTVLDGVLGIASGAIQQAAGFLESALARAIPVAIGFLAQHAGFAKLGTRIKETVEAIRKKVEEAIDWLVDKVVQGARAILERIGLGGPTGTPEERLNSALVAAEKAVSKFDGKVVGAVVLRPLLSVVRLRYGLTSLDVVKEGDYWAIEGVLNPKGKKPTKVKSGTGGAAKDTDSSVSQADLEALAKGLPDRWLEDGGRGRKHFRNKAAGHIWVRLQDPTEADPNFGVTGALRSGGGGALGFRDETNRQLRAHKLVGGVTVPTGGPGGLNYHTETSVANIAKGIKALNPTKVKSVEIKVYTFFAACAECLAELAAVVQQSGGGPSPKVWSRSAARGIEFDISSPPPGLVPRSSPNHAPATLLIGSAGNDKAWFSDLDVVP